MPVAEFREKVKAILGIEVKCGLICFYQQMK